MDCTIGFRYLLPANADTIYTAFELARVFGFVSLRRGKFVFEWSAELWDLLPEDFTQLEEKTRSEWERSGCPEDLASIFGEATAEEIDENLMFFSQG